MEINSYKVSGMTCAACTSAVERAVGKLDGVLSVHVHLLSDSMTVETDESRVSPQQVAAAVEAAGYTAALQNDEGSLTDPRKETEHLRIRLFASLAFLFPLLYLSMGEMLGLPVPAALQTTEGRVFAWLMQLMLAMPVVLLNGVFFIKGFKTLFRGTPTMDSLVAVGCTAALAYGIWTLAGILHSLAAGEPDSIHALLHRSYIESAATILTLVTLGKYLEARSLNKTTDALSRLLKRMPQMAWIIRNGEERCVAVTAVLVDDEVILKPGWTAPVDGVVLTGFSSMNEAMLTGESLPVEKFAGERILSGSVNQTGYLTYRASRVGSDSTLSKLIQLVKEAAESKAPIARQADAISRIFVPVVIVLAILTLIIWLLVGASLDFALNAAIAVLVISCPCALGLATPVALVVGTGKGVASGLLFRSGEAVETAGTIRTVVFDKTGTLTTGQPVVTECLSFTECSSDSVLQLAASLEKCSEHPLATAVLRLAEEKQLQLNDVQSFEAFPGKGISGTISGKRYLAGNEAYLQQNAVQTTDFRAEIVRLAEAGKTPLLIASCDRLLGCIAVSDELRPGAKETIQELQALHIKTLLLSGDRKESASYVANTLGIDQVISEVLPDQKAAVIQELQMNGEPVMMVGDGMNDAPALGQARVGVALGNGSDLSVMTADVVLTRNRPLDVVEVVRLSRAILKTIRQNLFWAFLYNVAGIPLAAGLLYPLTGWTLSPMLAAAAMSLSSVSVVTNSLRLRSYRFRKEAGSDLQNVPVPKYTKYTDDMKTKVIAVGGMSCGHCSSRVEKALNNLDGVTAQVELQAGIARAEYPENMNEELLKKAIEEAGYEVIGMD